MLVAQKSRDTSDLILTAKELKDIADLETSQTTLDQFGTALEDLDRQLGKAKLIVTKYKELVLKMQLQLNMRDRRIIKLKGECDQLRFDQRKMKDYLKSLHSQVSGVSSHHSAKEINFDVTSVDTTQQNLGELLEEVNLRSAEVRSIDTLQAKVVMRAMNSEQQSLLQQLLS